MFRLMAVLAALFIASSAAATTLWVDAAESRYLNLREGPTTHARVIRQMPHGSRVQVLARPGKWYKVQHQSGAIGWAHSKFLSEVRHAPRGTVSGRYWVHAPRYGALNLRQGPGKDHQVVLRMVQGSAVEALGRRGDWMLVRHVHTGKVGWAHANYLSRKPVTLPRIVPRHKSRHHSQATPLDRIIHRCADLPAHAFQRCVARGLYGHGHNRPYRGW